jgi:acyl carrier protein
MVSEPTKDQAKEIITNILIDVVGWIERNEISPNKELARDLHIASDDLTVFAMEVVKHFEIKPTPEEWNRTATIEEVASMVLSHLALKK